MKYLSTLLKWFTLVLRKPLAGAMYSIEYRHLKMLVIKHLARFLAPSPGTGNQSSVSEKKDLYTGCAIHNDFPVNAFCDGIDVLAEYYKLSKTQTCKKILTDFFGMDLYAPLTDADLESERRYKSTVRATETLDSDEVEKRLRKLEVLYHYTGEIKPGSPVGMYLRNRGLKRILSICLRILV
ncbi:hypothetical protein [Enterobacter cloacae complex sp. 288G10]|uniref:hypothetical protein n=1 Tax=Enterobacter cloacae complex sp. 288G10 TaxID=3395859 RepID=UPI003CF04EBD